MKWIKRIFENLRRVVEVTPEPKVEEYLQFEENTKCVCDVCGIQDTYVANIRILAENRILHSCKNCIRDLTSGGLLLEIL